MSNEDPAGMMPGQNKYETIYTWLRESLDNYLVQFDLTRETIRDSRILELGAFDRRLAAACLSENIPGIVYSLEPALAEVQKEGYAGKEYLSGVIEKIPPDVAKKVRERTIVGEAESIPMADNSVDLVVGRNLPLENATTLATQIAEGLRVSRKMRLYPINTADMPLYEEAIRLVKKRMPSLTMEYKKTTDEEIKTAGGKVHVEEKVAIFERE